MKKIWKVFLGCNIVAIYFVVLTLIGIAGYNALTENKRSCDHYTSNKEEIIENTEMQTIESEVIVDETDESEEVIDTITEKEEDAKPVSITQIVDKFETAEDKFEISQEEARKIAAEAYNCKLHNMGTPEKVMTQLV